MRWFVAETRDTGFAPDAHGPTTSGRSTITNETEDPALTVALRLLPTLEMVRIKDATSYQRFDGGQLRE